MSVRGTSNSGAAARAAAEAQRRAAEARRRAAEAAKRAEAARKQAADKQRGPQQGRPEALQRAAERLSEKIKATRPATPEGRPPVPTTISGGTNAGKPPLSLPGAVRPNPVREDDDGGGGLLGGLRDQVDGAVDGARNRIDGAVDGARDRVGGAIEGARNRITDAVGGARDRIRDAANDVRDAAEGAWDKARDAYDAVADTLDPERQFDDLNSPGDKFTVERSVGASAIAGGKATGSTEVERLEGGRFRIRTSGTLEAGAYGDTGGELPGVKAGVDASATQGVTGTTEYVASNEAEARRLFRLIGQRNKSNGLPTGRGLPGTSDTGLDPADAAFLDRRKTATELTFSGNANAGGGVKAGKGAEAGLDAGVGATGSRTLRTEYANGQPVRVKDITTESYRGSAGIKAGGSGSGRNGDGANGGATLFDENGTRTLRRERAYDLPPGQRGEEVANGATRAFLVNNAVPLAAGPLGERTPGLRPTRGSERLTVTDESGGERRVGTFSGAGATDGPTLAAARTGGITGAAREAPNAQLTYDERGFSEKGLDLAVGGKVEGIGFNAGVRNQRVDYDRLPEEEYSGRAGAYPGVA